MKTYQFQTILVCHSRKESIQAPLSLYVLIRLWYSHFMQQLLCEFFRDAQDFQRGGEGGSCPQRADAVILVR